MPELGKLWYSLQLKDSEFQDSIKKLESSIKSLDGKDIKLGKGDIEQAIALTERLQKGLDNISNKTDISITGTTKINATVDAEVLRKSAEDALKGINVTDIKVDPSALKNQLNSQLWNINVTTDASTASKVISKIKSMLNINTLTIRVAPDMSKNAIKSLRRKLETELSGLNVKITITKKNLQAELGKITGLYVNVDAKLHTGTLQAQLDKVKANLTLTNANVNPNGRGANGDNETTHAVQRTNKALNDQLGIRRSINDQMSANTQLATMFGNAIGNVFATYQLKNFLEALIQIGGEIQKQRMALGHIIGGDSDANQLFGQMKQLAVKSPYGLLDLMKNARQLSAFGVQYNELYDTMRRLSDVASGLGVDFGRISLAYGETLERTYLDGKLIRQFAYMGLPVLQEVAKYYNEIGKAGQNKVLDASDVRKMVSNREVSFEDLQAVMQRLTDEGGRFYNMQEVMAESVAGKWKNLKDAYDIMLSDMVDGNSQLLKAPAEFLTMLTRNYQSIIPLIEAVAVAMVGAKAASALMAAALGRENTALYANKLASLQSATAQRRRNIIIQEGWSGLAKSIGFHQRLTLEELKEVVATNSLEQADKKALAMRLAVNKANAAYLFQVGLIGQKTLMWATSNNVLLQGLGKITGGLQILRLQLANVTSQFLTMAAAMAYNPMTWITALGAVFMKYKQWSDNIEENQKRVAEAIAQARDEMLTTVSKLKTEMDSVDFDTASLGSVSASADAMVEFIKNKMADAPGILQTIFEKDKDGKYKKDARQIAEELREVINDMYDYALDERDFSSYIMEGISAADEFLGDDMFKNTKQFIDSQKKLRETIASVARQNVTASTQVYDEMREKYKDKIVEFFGVDNIKNVTDNQLRTLILNNLDMLQEYIWKVQKLAGYRIGSTSAYSSFVSDYTTMLQDIMKAVLVAKDRIEKEYADKGVPFSWDDKDVKRKWETEVKTVVTANGGDANSEEVLGVITRIMNNPKFLAQAKLNAYMGDYDVQAKRLLEEGDFYKTVWLMPKTMPNTKTPDVYEEMFGGAAKGATDYHDAMSKAEKNAKDHYDKLVALQNKGLIKLGRNQNGWYATQVKANATAYEDALADVNALNNQLNKAQEQGISLDYMGTSKNKPKSASQKDTLLEAWKEEFDELKKTYSEFEKWAKVVGKKNAGQKMLELGLIDKATADQLADPEYYRKKVEELQEVVRKQMGNNVARNKFNTSLSVEVGNIDLNIKQEALKKAQEKVSLEINNAAKEYDLWKTWFESTGDSGLASKMARSVTAIWNKSTEEMSRQLADKMGDAFANLDWGKNASMSDMEKMFAELGLSGEFARYKDIYTKIWQNGYEYQKKAASVAKEMMSYEEKLVKLEQERLDAITGANGDADLISKINASYGSKKAELDPQYKQFMGAVTTMTEEAAQAMANSIKLRLVRELSMGAKSIDEYAKAVEQVDAQLEKSEKRIKSFGEAWLLGKTSEYTKQRYNNAIFNEASARKIAEAAAKRLMKAQVNAESDNANESDLVELMQATEENSKAQEKLKKAVEEANKWLKKKNDENDDANAANRLNGVMSKMQSAFSALGTLGDSLELVLGKNNALSVIAKTGNTISQASNALKSVGEAFGGAKGSMIGAAIGTVIGGVNAFLDYNQNRRQSAAEDYKNQATAWNKMADVMKSSLERKLGGLYAYSTSDMRKALPQNSRTQNNGDKIDLGDGRSAYYTYYEAQQKMLGEQIEALTKASAEVSGMKGDHEGEVKDLEAEIAELHLQMKYLAEDMMKELYNIDFKDWAGQLGDALVDAWAKGEDGAEAYAEKVKELVKGVTKSVVSQSIIETALAPVLDDFKSAFVKNKGIMTPELINKLSGDINAVAPGLVDSVNLLLNNLKEMGTDLSDTGSGSGSASASIKNISEETADIIVALAEGMRLDLSSQRLLVEQIASVLGGDGNENSLQMLSKAQLVQLQQIAMNTYNNAQSAAEIKQLLDDVVAGNKEFNIQ